MTLNRHDSATARFVVETLLPDSEIRDDCLAALIKSIQLANQLAPGRWGVTLTKQQIRLNVGRIEVLTFRKDSLHFVLFAKQFPKVLKGIEGVVWNENPVYQSVPGSFYCEITPEDIRELLPDFLRYHQELIQRAAETSRHSMMATAHSPGVLRYLEEAYGVVLNDPSYSAKDVRLSALTFQQQFDRFNSILKHNSGRPFSSFRDGLPSDKEGYKERIRNNALRIMNHQNWTSKDVGSGRILSKVIRAIEINYNNLVAWQNRRGPQSQKHKALLKARSDPSRRRELEQWFFDFFHDRSDEAEAFESFRELAGNNYDLAAYVFFLKDWLRFMPIAPQYFDEAFKLFGIELVTSRNISWENYSRYNNALSAIRRSLVEVAGISDARLIDAHSFCWMLVRHDPPTEPEVTISLPFEVRGVSPPKASETGRSQVDGFGVVTDAEFEVRDELRRRLGRRAQEIAIASERMRLAEAGHPNPNDVVKQVWDQPGRGYDILSCEIDGTPRHIEVKAVRKSKEVVSFIISSNEVVKSRILSNYHIYCVTEVDSKHPKVAMLASNCLVDESLSPISYQARIALIK